MRELGRSSNRHWPSCPAHRVYNWAECIHFSQDLRTIPPMSTAVAISNLTSSPSLGGWFARHWFLTFAALYGLWVWLPLLAPVLMHIGWSGAGRLIYLVYSFFCHQLPERSFFFFGSKPMYSLVEIQAAWQNTTNPMLLRRFIGNESMGWKVAWSDRMISFYTSMWAFAVAWQALRHKIRALTWWGLLLLLLPILIDGGSHAISDLYGIGQGFRDTNHWLVALTRDAFPVGFYIGDAWGSFNSWMRLITGTLAGLGIVWFIFPHMEASFEQA
jgi:uncharacterized membrane protein